MNGSNVTLSLLGGRSSYRLSPTWLLGAFFVSACGGGAPDSSTGGPASTGEASATQASAISAQAGVRETSPGRYEAVMFAWDGGFSPSEIRVPAGAEVTFRLMSRDQPHGFLIMGTPVELDIFPEGYAEATHTFTEPGEYQIICHVYCGGGHDFMRATLIVHEGSDS